MMFSWHMVGSKFDLNCCELMAVLTVCEGQSPLFKAYSAKGAPLEEKVIYHRDEYGHSSQSPAHSSFQRLFPTWAWQHCTQHLSFLYTAELSVFK